MHLLRRTAVAFAAALGAAVLAAGSAAAAPSEQDQEWLVAAHQGNLAEIAAGQAALEAATTDEVRVIAQMLIEDHERLDQELIVVAEPLGVSLPETPTPAQQAELAEVVANSGQAFDVAWIALQIDAHRQALALGEEEIASGSDETVMNLARAAAPPVQHHLDELLAAARQYGVPTSVPGGTGGQAAESSSQMLGLGLAGAGVVILAATSLVLARRRLA